VIRVAAQVPEAVEQLSEVEQAVFARQFVEALAGEFATDDEPDHLDEVRWRFAPVTAGQVALIADDEAQEAFFQMFEPERGEE
jgi:hypothetical protein